MTAEQSRRWRLVLGRYAESNLPRGGGDAELDQALGYLYDREYTARGHRHAKGGSGSLDPSAVTAINWLGKSRGLFPASTLERLQADAVTRYGLDDLLADPGAVEALQPDRVLVLPDGVEDLWSEDYAELIDLA